jgi:hypothetical protein
LLDDHQARPLTEEDLIGGSVLHSRAAELVEDFQQGRRPASGGAGPAAQLGHAGQLGRGRAPGTGLGQQRGEEAAGDREADALGLGGTGEGSEGVLIEGHGGVEGRLEFAEGVAKVGDVLAEPLELLACVLAVEGLEDPLGVAIKRLAREALLTGSSADVAVRSVEDSGGIGDAPLGG